MLGVAYVKGSPPRAKALLLAIPVRLFSHALVFAIASCALPARRSMDPPKPSAATLFITSDLRGSLAPCGCSQLMRGGVAKIAAQLDAERASAATHKAVFYIDSGNTFFAQPHVPAEAMPQHTLQALAMSKALNAMSVNVHGSGSLDEVLGTSFRETIDGKKLLPDEFTLLREAAQTIAVLSASSAESMRKQARSARAQGAVFVLALIGDRFESTLQSLESASEIDLIVTRAPLDELQGEHNRSAGTKTRVVQLQTKGRSILRVDLNIPNANRLRWEKGNSETEREIDAIDRRIEILRAAVNEPMLSTELKAMRMSKVEELLARRQHLIDRPIDRPASENWAALQFIPIEATLPKSTRVAEIEADFDRQVGQLNLRWAQAHGTQCEPPSNEVPGYVGNEPCAQCHVAEAAFWSKTKHAQAYEDLSSVGKQYHLDCVSCHVTGWKQPGGVCRIDVTYARRGVGCESCHGPGFSHVAKPEKSTILRKPSESTCIACHDKTNSPHFSYATWIEKIVGEGHGK